MAPTEIRNILWTGGWDSTFRLLYSLILEECVVRPFYLIDTDRASTGIELRTMKNIKLRLFSKYPQTRQLLLPTQYKEVSDIAPNREITESYQRMQEKCFLGSQYEWLARFAYEEGIKHLELSTLKYGHPYKILRGFVKQKRKDNQLVYEVDDAASGTSEYRLFSFFRFPLFNFTKLDVKQLSEQNGFEDLMELTWFCHKPKRDGTPCGSCNPCRYTITGGMGYRIPFRTRITNRLKRLLTQSGL